eukprot:6485792-Amphidinium_carterae.1
MAIKAVVGASSGIPAQCRASTTNSANWSGSSACAAPSIGKGHGTTHDRPRSLSATRRLRWPSANALCQTSRRDKSARGVTDEVAIPPGDVATKATRSAAQAPCVSLPLTGRDGLLGPIAQNTTPRSLALEQGL